MWLILFLCQAVPPPPEEVEPITAPRRLFVIHDDSRESKMLVRELNRDWAKHGLHDLARIAEELRPQVELVHQHDDGAYRRLTGFPFWRLGERGSLNRFDERAFHDTGRPLLTLAAIHHNSTVDLKPWKIECERLTDKAEEKHLHAVNAWLRIAAPDRVNRTASEWGLAENYQWLRVQSEFAGCVGFPAFVAPKLPKSPLKLMPWE